MKKIITFLLLFVVLLVVLYVVFALIVRPSLDRNWNKDQKTLPKISFDGDHVSIQNIRNISYRTTKDFDVAHYDKTFDLKELETVWFMVEPFSGHGFGAAHTLLSFGFEDDSYVSVSVEIRKEEGESFSPVKGLFRQYELTYVVADERDVLKLRTNYRKDNVYLYPIKVTKEKARELFVSMLQRADKLTKEPEFYNTLTSTCTTNIVDHVNTLSPGKVPFSFKTLMPAYADEYALTLGLIDDEETDIMKLRAKYQINEKAEKYADDPEFSKLIREF
jgi:hypothetical protein